jgi:SAM-dependent methyltransferase
MNTPSPLKTDRDGLQAAAFTKPPLLVYDYTVLGFSNKFVWKCPTKQILAFYNTHISTNHLDIGVGTGYFLDKCTFPSDHPEITLVDVSQDALEITANRIARYHPKICVADVLGPLPLSPASFDSIGINYVLHCLVGTMASKEIVFAHLKLLLKPGGTIFGTTILGKDVPIGMLARRFLRAYNRTEIFNNDDDGIMELEQILKTHFSSYTLHTVGCVAFFAGKLEGD